MRSPLDVNITWLLGQLDDATHRAALLHADSAVRRNATRALGTDARAVSLFFTSGVVSDPDPLTKLAGFVKLAEFSDTKQIQTVVASIARNPANRADEWLAEATRILSKIHGAELHREGPNLLPNPGFEVVGTDGLPEGWKRRDYNKSEGTQSAEWKIVSPGLASCIPTSFCICAL